MSRVVQLLLVTVLSVVYLSGCSPLARGKNDFQLQHYQKAFTELLPVAREGNPEAQYAVGYLYYTGQGTNQDLDLAMYWFELAAKQHQSQAVKALSLIQAAKASELFPAPPGVGLVS